MSRSAAPSRTSLILGSLLCLFVLFEVNYPRTTPQTELAVFAGFGLVLCFLKRPLHARFAEAAWARWLDRFLALLSAVLAGYYVVQSEPIFRAFWLDGRTLGDRAGAETSWDTLIGGIGLVLVLEAARRAVGLALPILSLLFLAYGYFGPHLPSFLFPHRGYDLERLVAQTVLHSQGVFGVALGVMFTYVFLFVLFGALLEATGATNFILEWTRRLFHKSPGGAAKVAVISSGLMGSLSGSAVANVATTGTFTIPMMKSAGFRPAIAGGIEAAASSGGALMPPVMGAGAYMMLELVQPPVTFLEIVRAALIPAILYYFSLFCFVHFYARKSGALIPPAAEAEEAPRPERWTGIVFATAFGVLMLFLALGFTPFRSVTLALAAVLVIAAFRPSTRVGLKGLFTAFSRAAADAVPLICAAACVGILLGVVTLTGIGSRFPAMLVPLAQESLLLALIALMLSSIVLGMGLPSAVCYLLLATLVGPALGDLGVLPLAAHLFIFYFGMLSMVTPPVALAGYTAASIAGSGIIETSLAAFRIALVGFTLPFLFVLRPELLMLAADGSLAGFWAVAWAVGISAIGIVALAGSLAGYLLAPTSALSRGLMLIASLLLLAPGPTVHVGPVPVPLLDAAGLLLFLPLVWLNWRGSERSPVGAVSR